MAPTYDSASLWWGRQDAIKVWDETRTELLVTIPFEFLRTSGLFTYDLVLAIARHNFEQEGVLTDHEGTLLNLADQPQRGSDCSYILPAYCTATALRPRRGPEGKSALVKPASTTSVSSYSDSKHASARSGQTKFRASLFARDGRCILTKTHRDLCTAAHIVPISRFDVYKEIIGLNVESECYQTSMGFLIKDEWHGAYDRYEWSWYVKDGLYYPHFFAPKDPSMRQYQGRPLDPSLVMRTEPEEYPDPALCNWHYRQCVLARIRAVAMGF